MEYYSGVKRNKSVPFAETQMDLETVTQSEVRKRETNISINRYVWNLEKWYSWTYLQSISRNTHTENKCVDLKGRKWGGMNWDLGINMYTYYV